MTEDWRKETEPLFLDGGIHMPYSWTVGRTGSRFFIALRDEGKIMGNTCPKCEHVWVPPRLRCPKCFDNLEFQDWIEVGPEGTLRHFTIVRYEHPSQPMKPPFAYGLIDLDGTDHAMTHIVYHTDMESLRRGMRLKPQFAPERRGNILDILYFTPTKGDQA